MLKNSLKLILLFLIIIYSCETRNKKKTKYEFLRNVSNDLNKKCPLQVDSILRLENSVAFPPSTFRYNYILKYDTIKYDIHQFEESLRITTLNNIKTNPDGKILKDLKTTFEFNYSDTLGNHLFRIVITPDDYE